MWTWTARIAEDSRWVKAIAIASATVLVTSVASVGELEARQRAGTPVIETAPSENTGDRAARTTGGSDTDGGTAVAVPSAPPSSGSGTTGSTDGGTDTGSGPTSSGSTTGGTSDGATTGGTTGGTSGGTTGGTSDGGEQPVPDHGLKTQGVTDEYVKFGITYNMEGCGDAGILEAMFASATGDIGRAIEAYKRHINEEQDGINGREFQVLVADSGGTDCPEKAIQAAKQLADDEKVFAVFPGLHTVADYFADRKLPTFVGRDDPASLARYGANGIGLTQEIAGVLEAWAAFGEHWFDSPNRKPCIVRPESGVSGDWDLYSKIFQPILKAHNITMVDELVFQDDVQTAQQQSSAAAARLKAAGCDQVYFMAINPIAPVFFTSAATQAQWFPQWTFTSYMALSDTDLGGSLQDQRQWDNAFGLSPRILPGNHGMEGNCKRIYERYYQDGQGDLAAAQVICAAMLPAAEMMRRGEQLTGELTANSMLVGADTMGDYFFDAHVPLLWRFPAGGPYTTKAWRYYTVVDWNSARKTYEFPEFPTYWEYMGTNQSNGINMLERIPGP